MKDKNKENIENDDIIEDHSDYRPADDGEDKVRQLSGMYRGWFLDYASYVILERAVPHINDGLKPVQRRILHSMKEMDDGRYNKVANIVGHTMHYHPHGDASIGDALVQLGQKDLLIDCQGNWGNILTGDRAAAPRYIEARLSKFASDVVFNPKTTEWQHSYDGRNMEPVTLPVKFPLLLAQGAEGIAVGLSCKILPHNFNEICDAAVACLRGKEFHLYPDFPTGGQIDVEKYNDGHRGGSVKVRAQINKVDSKTLAITELPFGKTTSSTDRSSSSLPDSILKAVDKGKIKVKKVEDNTAAEVEILVHLASGASSDKTMDALYAFTDCEISISPNCCVIADDKPQFLSVSDVLRKSVENTKHLLRRELEIRRAELADMLHFASLERIFITERIYKDKAFEDSKNMTEAINHIDSRLEPFYPQFERKITRDDIKKLMEIKMGRILKFNDDKAEKIIKKYEAEMAEIDKTLKDMVGHTVRWFEMLKEKYGKDFPRRTEIRSFDTIDASRVVVNNEKLYMNSREGFIGTGLKKDEYICDCSDIDDIIVFFRDGTFKVVKVSEKEFVGKDIIHAGVFDRNDKRTIYNMCYRDGKDGWTYIKRFNVTSMTRDKEYDLTKGQKGSRVLYFTANPNGEAEIIKVTHKPGPKVKSLTFEKDFSEILIKGRQAMGNILTKHAVHKIVLKEQGASTLGGRKVWFDKDILRINYDEHGTYLGEFAGDDLVLAVNSDGEYRTTNFDSNNHYDTGLIRIEKFDPAKVFTAVLFDADNDDYLYLKRFTFEESRTMKNFLGEKEGSKLLILTDTAYPRIKVTFGGHDEHREPQIEDAEQFVGVKSLRAKGKRLTTYEVAEVEELEPLRFPEPEPEPEDEGEEQAAVNHDPDKDKSDEDIIDEITGQMKLFE